MLLEAVVLGVAPPVICEPALYPKAVFELPVVLCCKASRPTTTLLPPVVLLSKAFKPKAVF